MSLYVDKCHQSPLCVFHEVVLFSYPCVLQKRHIYIQMATASIKLNFLSRPFLLHQWECQCNLFNKLYQKVYALQDRSLHFLPLFNIQFKKKNTHCISAP